MRYLKTTLAVLGAVTLLVLAGNTIALATTGSALLMGKSNTANTITSISRTTAGTALSVKTKTSLSPPLKVNGVGKVTNLNADRLDGINSTGFVKVGGAGAPLGYAHILPNGTLDATRSWNVGASNVVSTSAGFWCFRGLGFTPHNGSVTIDYDGSSNGESYVGLLKMPTPGSHCGLSSAQAEVFTGVVASVSTTTGKNTGFYVLFY